MRYNANRETVKKKSPSKILVKLLVLLIIFGVVGYFGLTKYYDTKLNQPNSDVSQTIEFTIEEGETPTQIFQSLVSSNLISEEMDLIYKIYLRQTGLGATMQAGKYRIPQNLSLTELVATLQDAGIDDLWVTIPEGLRMDEIADILATEYAQYESSTFNKAHFLSLTTDQEFINSLELTQEPITSLEGFLFPDKYLLPMEATDEYVLTTLINTYKSKVPKETTYRDLIIASIIEREARTEYDRQMVSDIIRRRLDEGWFLGLDTVNLYPFKDWKYELTYADLQKDDPYNTRINIGLPPTPISNPGISSINASLNPEPNDYYYFITGNDGNFYYAITAAEHNQNIANHLK